ncbi:YeaC family protein [Lonsdalea quercina]|uniref:YeaC family protein n=1 Tax=Lonsdalea quercina TaxID=71657 RepID=UPI0039755698
MQIEDVLKAMTPEIYQRLVTAVELGKWPDGVALTAEQKDNAMQMVLLWQSRHNVEADHMSINQLGEIEIKSKQALKQRFVTAAEPIRVLKPQD